jgi:hypothetical protein
MKIVEDPPWIDMLKMMNANVVIPGRKTVARDIKNVFEIAQKHVMKELASAIGRKHLQLDGWSSPNVMSILGICVTYLHRNEIRCMVLDCYRCV